MKSRRTSQMPTKSTGFPVASCSSARIRSRTPISRCFARSSPSRRSTPSALAFRKAPRDAVCWLSALEMRLFIRASRFSFSSVRWVVR